MYAQMAYDNICSRERHFSEARAELPLRILVIDDNRDFACTLSSLLKHQGYASSVAYDGKSGIDKIWDLKPDLILCDIGLPDRGCYRIIEIIRSNPSMNHMIVAALTCYMHERVKLLVKELGFDFYISKPIQTSILDDILQKVQLRKTNLVRKAYLTTV